MLNLRDLFRHKKRKLSWEEVWQPDFALFHFGRSLADAYTVGDSFKHAFVSGATGSGKTSGSLATLFRWYLKAGYGGLWLCAKPDEVETVKRYAKEAGRLGDLVIVTIDGGMPYRFNFLDYHLRRQGRGSGSVTSLVNVFASIQDIIENNTKESLGEDFWDRTAMELVTYAVIILSLCDDPLTVRNIKRFIASAPHRGQANDPIWRESYCAQRMEEAYRKPKSPREERDLQSALEYFTQDLLELGDRTRSSIQITFTSIANRFLTGDTRELLSTDSNIDPVQMWEQGKIFVLDMPVSQYDYEGLVIQGVIKHSFAQAVLRRQYQSGQRPVFFAQDEYQNFCSKFDFLFLSEARSHGCSVVMATQSISNLYSVLGGGARDAANSLLGNAGLKIFHANTDTTTNDWASQVVGQTWMQMKSTSMKGGKGDIGINVSQQIHARLLPSDFASNLRTGGAKHGGKVDGYVIQTGRGRWRSSGKVYVKATFQQPPQE